MLWSELPYVVLPGLILLLIALGTRAFHGHWLAPAAFFSLVWCAYYLLGGIGIFIQGQPLGFAGFIVVALIGVFALGAMVADILTTEPVKSVAFDNSVNLKRLLPITLLFSAAAAYSVPGVLAYAGFSLLDISSLDRLQNVVSAMSDLRYGELADEPLLVRAALGFLYVAALFAGLLFTAAERKWQRAMAFLPLVISLIYVLITTSKTPMMMVLMMFIGAMSAERVRRSGTNFPFITIGQMLAAVMLVSLSMVYLYFLVQLRANDFESGSVVGEGFRSYFFSHLATFAAWIDLERINPSPLSWGQYSLSGLLGRLGLAERQAGIYASVVMPATGDLSNLFTVFRGVLQDLGAAGGTLFIFIAGGFSHWLYARALAGSRRATSLLAIVYFTAMLSFLYSPFIFNNIIAACLIYVVLSTWLTTPKRAAL